jgi:DNA-binding CsgD family transcriptional regulator
VFSILVSLVMPPLPQMLLVIILPLLASGCFYFANITYKDEKDRYISQTRSKGFEKYALLVQVVIFTIVLVFVRALSNIGIWGENRSNFTGMTELSVIELAIICSLILIISYLIFILPRKRLSLVLRCIIGFAVMLLGLQILAITNDIQFTISFDAVTSAIEIFAHLVRWMIVIECIRCLDTPHYRISGISNLFYVTTSFLWAHLLSNMQFATSTFVMIVVYLFLIVVFIIFIRSTLNKNSQLATLHLETEEAAAKIFAHKKGLSPRESEIFALLIEGLRRQEIQQLCELSEGTVKTHISSIYKKLDVHSKRDMLEMFEASKNNSNSKQTTQASDTNN